MPELEKKLANKNRLLQICFSLIEQRIIAAKLAIEDAQYAANQEEKSSAGDKHETSRAMGHLQKEMLSGQLAAQIKELSLLHSVNTGTIQTSPVPGSVIVCKEISFFIAAGLGRQLIDGSLVVFLSPHAPLARALSGKKISDQVFFNGVENRITDIY